MDIIEAQKILEMIPHRYPFLLVDRVLEYEAFKRIVAIKNVTMNEHFFAGHFPGQPVMPGVLIIEALAQASAILCHISEPPEEGFRKMYYFAGMNNVKFKKMVLPGDTLRLSVEAKGKKRGFWQVSCTATVDDTIACTADLLSAAKDIKSD